MATPFPWRSIGLDLGFCHPLFVYPGHIFPFPFLGAVYISPPLPLPNRELRFFGLTIFLVLYLEPAEPYSVYIWHTQTHPDTVWPGWQISSWPGWPAPESNLTRLGPVCPEQCPQDCCVGRDGLGWAWAAYARLCQGWTNENTAPLYLWDPEVIGISADGKG